MNALSHIAKARGRARFRQKQNSIEKALSASLPRWEFYVDLTACDSGRPGTQALGRTEEKSRLKGNTPPIAIEKSKIYKENLVAAGIFLAAFNART